MLEVGVVSSGMAGETYQWADGVESVGVLFRYLTEDRIHEFGDRLSVLVTTGKIYDNRPHLFWLDENCSSVPITKDKVFITPRAATKFRVSNLPILPPIIGPRPKNGTHAGVCGPKPDLTIPTVSVTDPVSLANCNVILVSEPSCWTEGFEMACRNWGLVVVTGIGWTKPNANWILIDPKWGWERPLREGMKRVNNKLYEDAKRRAGMMPTGAESLAAAARRAMPNHTDPISRKPNHPPRAKINLPPATGVAVVAPRPIQTPNPVSDVPSPTIHIPVTLETIQPTRTEYVTPGVAEMTTPTWFSQNGDVEVSIIVPMWKSAQVIPPLIQSWDFSGPAHEIIFVNDSCPHHSHQHVVTAFSNRQPTPGIGRIFSTSHQGGFATACNIGAAHAKGKYLIFLNADTTVTPGWINPLVNMLKENSNIGLLGNLQLKSGDLIDSAGSQWMDQTRSFEHIGRNVWKGQRLNKRLTVSSAPEEMLADGKRQMVTGCCFSIAKDFFNAIGGFDIKYRIGYWEDADLCMKVWEAGKEVHFTSKSRIYHKGSHSGSGHHPYMKENSRLFYSKWVDNKKFDQWIRNDR